MVWNLGGFFLSLLGFEAICCQMIVPTVEALISGFNIWRWTLYLTVSRVFVLCIKQHLEFVELISDMGETYCQRGHQWWAVPSSLVVWKMQYHLGCFSTAFLAVFSLKNLQQKDIYLQFISTLLCVKFPSVDEECKAFITLLFTIDKAETVWFAVPTLEKSALIFSLRECQDSFY